MGSWELGVASSELEVAAEGGLGDVGAGQGEAVEQLARRAEPRQTPAAEQSQPDTALRVHRRAVRAALRGAREQALVSEASVRAEIASWTAVPDAGRRDGVPATATRRADAPERYVQRDFSLPGTPALHERRGPDDPLVAVLCSPTDDPADRVRTGAALLEVLVVATLDGAGASYLNQPVELPRTRALLRGELSLPGVPQLVLRLGVGGPVAATPRRGLPDVVAPARSSDR